MFVQFTDKDGRETWINPLHVKVVREHKGMLSGSRGTEVWFSFNGLSEAIYVPQSPSEVAAMLDAALPERIVLPPDDAEDEDLKAPGT